MSVFRLIKRALLGLLSRLSGRYISVGLLPDIRFAIQEAHIKVLFLNINVMVGAGALIVGLIRSFSNDILTNIVIVAFVFYIAIVAIAVIEYVFYADVERHTQPPW